MFIFSRQGHLSMVVQLMKYGADPSLIDGEGCSCVHLAAQFGHTSIVAYLIAKGQVENAAAQYFHKSECAYVDFSGICLKVLLLPVWDTVTYIPPLVCFLVVCLFVCFKATLRVVCILIMPVLSIRGSLIASLLPLHGFFSFFRCGHLSSLCNRMWTWWIRMAWLH